MGSLDQFLPDARLTEVDWVEVPVAPEVAWKRIRDGGFADSWITRVLFALRTFAERRAGQPPPRMLRLDQFVSTPERPGFRVLSTGTHEAVVGAIGKVWRLRIPFVHLDRPEEFARFSRPGFVKVAWSIRALPAGKGCRVQFEVRVTATDERSWRRFRWYFLVVGPFSRLIRRSSLASLARELGEGRRRRRLPVAAMAAVAVGSLLYSRRIGGGRTRTA